MSARGLSARHAQDLLTAFRLDATKRRYADWNDLMSYCAYSAMRSDVSFSTCTGRHSSTWAASDPICAALQIINHLQDCGEDYRDLDRVYLPMDRLAAHGAPVEALGAKTASAPLRGCIAELAAGAADLLREGAALANEVADWRLRLEISVIQTLAMRLTRILASRDPLARKRI